MAECIIPTHYPNQIDITRTPLAFGDRAVPRLVIFPFLNLTVFLIVHQKNIRLILNLKNRELNDKSSLLNRQRALRSLCDYLHDPEHIATCIEQGIPSSLKTLLKDTDDFCRYKSAECLYVLSCNSNGRRALINEGIVSELSVLFNDKEPMARKNSHKTIEMLSEFPFGILIILSECFLSYFHI